MSRQQVGSVTIVLVSWFLASPPLLSQPIPVAVALSGQSAPGGGVYGLFSTSTGFFQATVNSTGRVFFYSPDLGTPVPPAGTFAGIPGSVVLVARQGSPSPAGPNYTNSFSANSQNDAGQIAFSCSLQPPGPDPIQGLFFGTPGSLQMVAFTGDPAPSGLGNWGFGFGSPGISASGVLSFNGPLTAGPSTGGFFVGTPGNLQPAVVQGQAAPPGGTFTNFLRGGGSNSSGQTLFYGGITGGPASNGLFLTTPGSGSFQVIARQSLPAPSGGNYNSISTAPTMNGAGKIAFSSSLTGGSATEGVFAGTPGALQTVVLAGDVAPGAGGRVYSSFVSTSLNIPGQLAFQANLTSDGIVFTSGIFLQSGGVVDPIAVQGGTAPGGALFSSFDGSPELNNLGQLAFQATLSGSGVNASNDKGLYIGSLSGLTQVVREGQVIDVDSGPGLDLRTIASIGFSTSRSGSFTDSGFITYTLAFTDDTSGVFVANISAVPEPSTFLLCGTVVAGALRYWSRRRRATIENTEHDGNVSH